jgi:hypothetical protein
MRLVQQDPTRLSGIVCSTKRTLRGTFYQWLEATSPVHLPNEPQTTRRGDDLFLHGLFQQGTVAC